MVKVVPKPLVPGGADERQDAAEDEFIIDRYVGITCQCAYSNVHFFYYNPGYNYDASCVRMQLVLHCGFCV